jgi:ATP-dependent Clp protease ATP-binding subunit ClpA
LVFHQEDSRRVKVALSRHIVQEIRPYDRVTKDFKPELLIRLDDIVIFRALNTRDARKFVELLRDDVLMGSSQAYLYF